MPPHPPRMTTPRHSPAVSLKEHLETRIDGAHRAIAEVDLRHQQRADLQDKAVAAALASAEKAVDAALAAQEAAVTKAEKQGELWRASANEWRGTMNDREAKFAQITMLSALEERVRELADRVRTIEAHKEGVGSGWTHLGQFVALAAAVIAIVLSLLR